MQNKEPEKLVTWEPRIGESLNRFVSQIAFLNNDLNAQEELKSQAIRILARCANPSVITASKSVLVLGQVQSGKTLSFTSVIAAARDNRIPLTVLLAGTKRSLMQQTFERLERDLLSDSRGSTPKWIIKKDVKVFDKSELIAGIRSQHDSLVPDEYRKSIVLVTMKNKAGIMKVESVIKAIINEVGFSFPVLVIDDEGDQASPNTKQEKDERSATYAAIWELRDSLSNHSFLSYTATPEANLLLEIQDMLSPESVVVLNPGENYLGGYDLFVDRSSRFSKLIEENELEIATNPSPNDSPPRSLVDSLAYFFVTLAIAQKSYPQARPVSMLIHPDSKIDSHNQYKKWVKSIVDRWTSHFEEIFSLDNPEFKIPTDFETAINEIQKTLSIEEIFRESTNPRLELFKLVRYWITSNSVETRVINSANSSNNLLPSEWPNRAGWILIGAGKLDRGFVVENLVVTYMPRGRGGGNVDTIQQRGRFFGYKKSYRELLRGWMSEDLINAYREIVETENEMRKELQVFDAQALRLKDWRRNMVLAYGLAPTRKNVISMDYTLLNLKDNSWFKQQKLFDPVLHDLQSQIEDKVISLLSQAEETSLDNREQGERHLRTVITLPELLDLLIDWPMSGDDKITFDKHLLLLSKYSQTHSNTHASVFFMNQLKIRERSADKTSSGNSKFWSINNLHEGRSSSSKGKYIGDSNIKNDDALTVQIHNVAPRVDRVSKPMPPILALALSWPNGFSKRVLEQN